jgi:hypothetical protein
MDRIENYTPPFVSFSNCVEIVLRSVMSGFGLQMGELLDKHLLGKLLLKGFWNFNPKGDRPNCHKQCQP